MKYQGEPDYVHGSTEKIGILITNLGTPDSPTKKGLRPYLKEFLSDTRVIETPKIVWQLILNLIILNTRPAKSAEAYKEVWTNNGSPILDTSIKQVAALEKMFPNYVFGLGMRYGNPSIESALIDLRNKGARKILVFPLYPQYCAATTASTFDKVTSVLQKWRWIPELRFVNNYFEEPSYIKAVANSIKLARKENGIPDLTVFSYHGIPKEYLTKGDPYHCFCRKTTRLVKEHLKLDEDAVLTTFQSRFGPAEWLQPYTDETMKSLPKKGITHIHVLCPGFSSDCLETIEEIDGENREYFEEHGGGKFVYIPCLNDSQDNIKVLSDVIKKHTTNW